MNTPIQPEGVLSSQAIERALKEHPFSKGLPPAYIQTLAGCASRRAFQAGEYLWRQGEESSLFFLISSGDVSLEIWIPNQGPLPVDTVGAGELLGLSWLGQYRWPFDARAVTGVEALALDAQVLGEKRKQDEGLDYQLLKRLAPIFADRLQAMRSKLLDVYKTNALNMPARRCRAS